MKLAIVALCFLVFLSSCQTAIYEISGKKHALATIQKIILSSLPEGLNKKTANGREYISNFFSCSTSDVQEDERCYALVRIIGNRRPYNVFIEVFVMKHQYGEWVNIGEDIELSKKLATKVQKKLSEIKSEHNMVDDFRAF